LDDEEDEGPDPAIREQELRELVASETRQAVAAKKSGDTKTALTHLKQKKVYDAELKEHLEKFPPGVARP